MLLATDCKAHGSNGEQTGPTVLIWNISLSDWTVVKQTVWFWRHNLEDVPLVSWHF